MILNGKYNQARIYAETLDDIAREQILQVCDQEAFSQSHIAIMPDCHAGKGCTIGTTMTIHDKVVPGMVGVDIGCGMETVELAEGSVDFDRLDRVIRENVPCGREVREAAHPLAAQAGLERLRCRNAVDLNRAELSIGSLGGGNHFIEVDRSEDGRLYLVIHSGSRQLGTQVCNFYQNAGIAERNRAAEAQVRDEIARLKAQGRSSELQTLIPALRRKFQEAIPQELNYIEGTLFADYLHDMAVTQAFAALNRKAMVDTIVEAMGLTVVDCFTTIHNYIDTEAMILRKGAVSAQAGQKLLIPINMRDGSLICTGKGNPDWNCSAPHGAGRLLSRKLAKTNLDLEEYRRQMAGIYTTCVSMETLDESPMAYKNMDEILRCITPTVEVQKIIRPVYNFKAAE